MNEKARFLKVLESIAPEKHRSDVFANWLEVCCLSFANVRYFNQNKDFNDRFEKIKSQYKNEDFDKFAELLGITADALYYPCDFLGDVYMSAEFGNSHLGQFFTPYCLCQMCAKVNVHEVDKSRILTASESCVGGGAMIIALAEQLALQGFDYQNNLYVEAMDLSFNSVCMAMIQFSLLGIPAVVVHGNSLTLETFGVYETPSVGFTLIQERLKAQKRSDAEKNIKIEPVILGTENKEYKQLELF